MENPTERQKQQLKRQHEGFNTQFETYPVLVMIDPLGRRYASISGTSFPDSIEAAAQWLQSRRDDRVERDRWIKAAQS